MTLKSAMHIWTFRASTSRISRPLSCTWTTKPTLWPSTTRWTYQMSTRN